MKKLYWLWSLTCLLSLVTFGCGGSDRTSIASTSTASQSSPGTLRVQFERSAVLGQTVDEGFSAADTYAVSVLQGSVEVVPTSYFEADLVNDSQIFLITVPSGTFDIVVSAYLNGNLLAQVSALGVNAQAGVTTIVGTVAHPLEEYSGGFTPVAPEPRDDFGGTDSGTTGTGTGTGGGTTTGGQATTGSTGTGSSGGGTTGSSGTSGTSGGSGTTGGTTTGGSGGTTGGGTNPPFAGTVFLSGDVITDQDPTTYQSITYQGQADRTVFDRRTGAFGTINAYIFLASFSDRASDIEVVVNPEFGGQSAAQAEAEYYANAVGRIPAVLKTSVDALWIHQGVELYGGGNQSILIHTGQTPSYVNQGVLEEVLVHEASHTSLDWSHGGIVSESAWQSAQQQDGNFISTYARDFPNQEDVAESFLPYIIVRLRADRVSPSLVQTIEQTIPNRILYFDGLSLDLSPVN